MRNWVSLVLFLALLVLPGAVFAAFVNNGNGTVTDTTTGLIWQQADDGISRSWEQALAYCEGSTLANQTDWRLPNIRELKSIVDDSRCDPAMDPAFSCRSYYYWSGTTVAYSPYDAWGVGFDYGSGGWGNKDYSYYVRCVRGGPSGSFGTLILSLPIATDNPSRALLGNVGGAGPGRVNSWFDHAYPNYGTDDKLTRWDGAPVFSNANMNDCTQGQTCYNGHNGIDFSHNKDIANEDVYAAAPGTVFGKVSTCKEGVPSCNSYYGNQVWINHGNGYATRYNHLQEEQVYVADGQDIGNPSSTPLGKMGNTGKSYGTHLHFGVYYDQNQDGTWSANEVIDPYGWYDSDFDPCSVNNTCVTHKWMWGYPFQTLQYVDTATGVTISSPAAFTTVDIPPGAITEPVNVELQDVPAASDSGTGFFSAGRAFLLKVVGWFVGESVSLESSLGLNADLSAAALNSFAVPVTVTIEYADEEIKHLNENQLTIFWWNETTNQYVPLPTQVDTVLNKASAQTTEVGRFDLQAPLLCTGDVSEPNDVYGAATAVATDGASSLQRFDIAQDEDWFYLDATSGKNYLIKLHDLAVGVRAVVTLYDSDGTTVLATKKADASSPAELNVRAAHGGAYFLRISLDSGSSLGCSSTYNLSLKHLQGAFPSVFQLLLF